MHKTFATIGGALVAATLLLSPAQGSVLLFEPFDYPVGVLADPGNALPVPPLLWGAHSGGGSTPLQVVLGSLSRPGMDGDLVAGNSVAFTHGGGTREDAGRPFLYTPGTDGNILYVSYLLQVTSVTGTDYHFHLSDDVGTGATFRGRVFTRPGTVANTVQIGLQYASSGVVFDTVDHPTGGTLLVVMRYDLTNAANHVTSLWVNPTLGETTAPAPLLNDDQAATAATNVVPARVNVRQGSSGTAELVIDQIVVATTWAEATPAGDPLTSATMWSLYN